MPPEFTDESLVSVTEAVEALGVCESVVRAVLFGNGGHVQPEGERKRPGGIGRPAKLYRLGAIREAVAGRKRRSARRTGIRFGDTGESHDPA